MSWTIREEQQRDVAAIHDLLENAFADHDHSDGIEQDLVEQLRRDRTPMLALVAVEDDAVVGHITFSPVTITDGSNGWFGLGPLAVLAERQRAGIGSALCKAGLDRLRSDGASGCVVLGDPAYYRRFGFERDPGITFPGAPAEYFQRVLFVGEPPRGIVRYAPAFG